MTLLAGELASAELGDRLAALREVARLGAGRLDRRGLSHLREVLDRAEARLARGGTHTIVGLAGASGSGKSSLYNALAGLELAEVSARRPTTVATMACTFGQPRPDALLDWLQVPPRRRVESASALDPRGSRELDGLVLLDLPDHDTIEESHLAEVQRLVGMMDLLIWVVDPQKYADAALHDRFLRMFAGYDEVVIVVLNQIDRLPPGALPDVVSDLRRQLTDDGLLEVPLLTVSARTGEGVDVLRARLAAVVERRQVSAQRLSADLDAVSDVVLDAVGEQAPVPLDEAAAERIVTAATDSCELARSSGILPRAGIERAVRDFVESASGHLPKGWERRARRGALAQVEALVADIDTAAGDTRAAEAMLADVTRLARLSPLGARRRRAELVRVRGQLRERIEAAVRSRVVQPVAAEVTGYGQFVAALDEAAGRTRRRDQAVTVRRRPQPVRRPDFLDDTLAE